ncbi:hypothetical protein RFW93_09185, partial [Acinetobacter baumannii]|nr:hypothetical protein [Acinetobacter baumannii]
ERAAFADTIAGRAETVDNFAKGADAVVSIKEALIQAYEPNDFPLRSFVCPYAHLTYFVPRTRAISSFDAFG